MKEPPRIAGVAGRLGRYLAFGVPELDARFGAGGLSAGGVHEIAAADHRATPAAWGFLLALASLLLRTENGALLWAEAPHAPAPFGPLHAPMLACFALDPARVLFARPASGNDLQWTLEEALRSRALALVIGARPPRLSFLASRRLKLAAAESDTPLLLFRAHDDEAPAAAHSRWRVSPRQARRDAFGFLAAPRWEVSLERGLGACPGRWIMEWDRHACGLRLSSPLAAGAAADARAAGRTVRAA